MKRPKREYEEMPSDEEDDGKYQFKKTYHLDSNNEEDSNFSEGGMKRKKQRGKKKDADMYGGSQRNFDESSSSMISASDEADDVRQARVRKHQLRRQDEKMKRHELMVKKTLEKAGVGSGAVDEDSFSVQNRDRIESRDSIEDRDAKKRREEFEQKMVRLRKENAGYEDMKKIVLRRLKIE